MPEPTPNPLTVQTPAPPPGPTLAPASAALHAALELEFLAAWEPAARQLRQAALAIAGAGRWQGGAGGGAHVAPPELRVALQVAALRVHNLRLGWQDLNLEPPTAPAAGEHLVLYHAIAFGSAAWCCAHRAYCPGRQQSPAYAEAWAALVTAALALGERRPALPRLGERAN